MQIVRIAKAKKNERPTFATEFKFLRMNPGTIFIGSSEEEINHLEAPPVEVRPAQVIRVIINHLHLSGRNDSQRRAVVCRGKADMAKKRFSFGMPPSPHRARDTE
jgi:hypothetical protein